MDKNSVIGLVLIFVILFAGMWLSQPSDEELKAQQEKEQIRADSLRNLEQVQRSIEVVADTPAESTTGTENETVISQTVVQNYSLDSLARLDSIRKLDRLRGTYGNFSASAVGEEEFFTIENDKIKITLSSLGGAVTQVELKEYKTHDSMPLFLFEEKTAEMNLSFNNAQGNELLTSELYFEPHSKSFTISGDDEETFVFRLATASGDYLEYEYLLKGNSYDLGYSINFNGLQNELTGNELGFHWEGYGKSNEKTITEERRHSTIFYRYFNEEEVENLSEAADDEEQPTGKVNWVAFKQNFFSAIVTNKNGFGKQNAKLKVQLPTEDSLNMFYFANLSIATPSLSDGSIPLQFYFGPNHYQTLESYDLYYQDVIDLGWGIFGWMNEWLVIPIFNFLDGYALSYGLIILILTFIIKLILFPLTYKNYKSSAKMKLLKPEIEALNKKHEKDDAMKRQQATMGLYKKAGVNPMAGCIPMIIQMPVLYAMFRFFPASIELRQQSFLWADDLSSYDSIWDFGFDIPLYGDHMSLFTILMAISTIFYTKMNSGQMTTTQPGMPNMKVMMYLFPVMMLFFFNNFAAGLSYYYLLANLISIGQMLVIKRFIIDEKKIRAQIESNKKKPVKQSAFQKRLAEAAKQRAKK